MPKFSIAFIVSAKTAQLHHRLMEADDKETALRTFFNEEAVEYYSNDEQGFMYFKEDFYDESNPGGSVIPL
jgi:hypothetical protein